MNIDLASFDLTKSAGEGAKCELRHPGTNEPLLTASGEPVYILLAGMDSKVYQNKSTELENARYQRNVDSKKKGKSNLLKEVLDDNMELIVECTLGWGNLFLDGAMLKFDKKVCVDIYTRFGWIREQAYSFIVDRSNYLRD